VRARRLLAAALSPATLARLAALWLSPDRLAVVQATLASDAFWGGAAAAVPQSLRWEAVLSWLLLSPAPAAAPFEPGAVLAGLLRQRSEHGNQEVGMLRTELGPTFHGLEIPNGAATAHGDTRFDTRLEDRLEDRLDDRLEDRPALHARLQAWLQAAAAPAAPDPWPDFLGADPEWARQTLQTLGRSVRTRRLLATALPPATLARLAALWLSPDQLAVVQATLASDAFWGGAAAAVPQSWRWEAVLSWLLLSPAPAAAPFEPEAFFDTLLRQRSEREGRALALLLHGLDAAWGPVSSSPLAPAGADALLRSWLRTRLPPPMPARLVPATGLPPASPIQPPDPGRPGEAAPLSSHPAAGPAQHRGRLDAALARGALAGAEDDWAAALGGDAVWLRQALRRHGRSAEWRDRVAQTWDEAALDALARLWRAPAEHAAAPAAAGRPTPSRALAGPDAATPATGGTGLDVAARRRWHRTLEHLLAQPLETGPQAGSRPGSPLPASAGAPHRDATAAGAAPSTAPAASAEARDPRSAALRSEPAPAASPATGAGALPDAAGAAPDAPAGQPASTPAVAASDAVLAEAAATSTGSLDDPAPGPPAEDAKAADSAALLAALDAALGDGSAAEPAEMALALRSASAQDGDAYALFARQQPVARLQGLLACLLAPPQLDSALAWVAAESESESESESDADADADADAGPGTGTRTGTDGRPRPRRQAVLAWALVHFTAIQQHGPDTAPSRDALHRAYHKGRAGSARTGASGARSEADAAPGRATARTTAWPATFASGDAGADQVIGLARDGVTALAGSPPPRRTVPAVGGPAAAPSSQDQAAGVPGEGARPGPAPESMRAAPWAGLAGRLHEARELGAADRARCAHELDRLLRERAPAERLAWIDALESGPVAQRLLGLASADQLARLLDWLRPADAGAIRHLLGLVQTACRQTATPVTDSRLTTLLWRAVLRELFEEGRPWDAAGFTQRLAAMLVEALHPPEPRRWLTALAAAVAGHGADAASNRAGAGVASRPASTALEAAPEQNRALVAETTAAALATRLAPGAMTRGAAPSSPAVAPDRPPATVIHLANAGLVLAGSYLERLFAMLGLTHGPAFIDDAAADRAVHLLQFVVTGASATPEPLLVLNKLLCGLPLATPVSRGIEITEPERSAIEGMLKAIIAHWKIIGRTSVAGLRESFLQREGRLASDDEGWQLQVEPRAYDMLLDQLPWGYRLLKFPWMDRCLHVDWR
jgi:hypothetical protein